VNAQNGGGGGGEAGGGCGPTNTPMKFVP